jgi:ribosomal protein S18 acetylase RimI-like enzyme
MPADILPATPDMAPVASILIYLTLGIMADYLFGMDNAQKALRVLESLFQAKSSRFSYRYTEVVSLSGKVAGLAITYPARLIKTLELPLAIRLFQVSGISGFYQFVRRVQPLLGIKEAENDEYFIDNIAVLPEQQGQGLGKLMLDQIEKRAREQGFDKVSLTVDKDNEHAIAWYLKTGFDVVQTVEIEQLRRRFGYAGYHRMLKVLK